MVKKNSVFIRTKSFDLIPNNSMFVYKNMVFCKTKYKNKLVGIYVGKAIVDKNHYLKIIKENTNQKRFFSDILIDESETGVISFPAVDVYLNYEIIKESSDE